MAGSVIPHNRCFSIYQTNISSNGTYLTLNRAIPIGVVPGTWFDGSTTLDDVGYEIVTGSGVSAGTVTFQFLGYDGVWRNGPASSNITLTASTTFSNNLASLGLCPCVGVQIVVSGLTGGNIVYAHIVGRAS